MAIICPTDFAEWKDLYEDWSEAYGEIDELRETALMIDATMVATCAGAVATVETIVGGIVGGAACAIALWALADAIDDLNEKIDESNTKAAASNAQGDVYNKCVADHKKDP